MFEPKTRHEEVRSNRAVSPLDRPVRPAADDARRLWSKHRPNLLARMARAAQDVVREARDAADVPLPHLYRGRDFDAKKRAA